MTARLSLQSLTLITAMLTLAGCAGTGKDLSEVESQADDDVARIAEWDYEELYEAGGIRSAHLMGMPVLSADGEEIGDIQNIILNQQNQIVALIAEVGGFWDIGDTHVAIPWSEADLTEDGVRSPLRQDNLDQYSLFGEKSPVTRSDLEEPVRTEGTFETGPNTWKLTSLLGDYASLEDQPGYGYVDEVIFSEDGQLQAVVIESGGVPYAYPFGGYDDGWHPGYDALRLPYRERDIGGVRPFNYDLYPSL